MSKLVSVKDLNMDPETEEKGCEGRGGVAPYGP